MLSYTQERFNSTINNKKISSNNFCNIFRNKKRCNIFLNTYYNLEIYLQKRANCLIYRVAKEICQLI